MITFTRKTLAALVLGAAILATAPAWAGGPNGSGNGSGNGQGNGSGNGNGAPNGQATASDSYNLRIVGIELPAKALAR